jgi:putative membrane protein
MRATVYIDGFGGFGVIALIGFVLWIAFVVLVIALIVLAIRWLIRSLNASSPPVSGGAGDDTALALLRERFARGEIDADEYELRRKTLGG